MFPHRSPSLCCSAVNLTMLFLRTNKIIVQAGEVIKAGNFPDVQKMQINLRAYSDSFLLSSGISK